MLLLIKSKADKSALAKAAEDLDGYIKVVVDIELKILTAGGERHAGGEQLLLKNGSQQENLWGGGFDIETKEIDYNSIINLRPAENQSRDILSSQIRTEFDTIVKALLFI